MLASSRFPIRLKTPDRVLYKSEFTCFVQDLAVLVNDQGLMLDDIESNIERTADRTRAAGSELVRAERYQRSSRNKMCMIVLIVAFVLAVLVLVFSL